MVSEIPSLDLLNPLWRNAKWDVSGIFANDKELIYFHDYFLNRFGIKPFSLIHGAPLCIWNSGRVNPKMQMNTQRLVDSLGNFIKRNIAIDVTFTNLFIKEEHLDDLLGNNILEALATYNPTGDNAVILSSDVLYSYIKEKYPTLKLVSSILKVSWEKGKNNLAYYEALADRFDKVMVHPDDSTNIELLSQLKNPEKFEILLNENCVRQCPIRHKHYESLSNLSLNYLGHSDDFENMRLKNLCVSDVALLSNTPKCTTQLTPDEILVAYQAGIRFFKIQGRGLHQSGSELMDMLRLMFREDALDETMMWEISTDFLESLAEYLHS